jgi:GH25 family lysozyme M1 (1,4-beta-N-acetylmuramidase)
MAIKKVIDVSKHNGTIDFAKVKAGGIISGVIIRAGYGRLISQKDPNFETYYKDAKAAGLNIGAYWYSYATTAAEAATEAAVFLEAIKGKEFDLPVYFDIEEEKQLKLGKTICSAMVSAFCGALEEAGYFAGVYSYDSFFGSNLSSEIQKKYSCWVARLGSAPKYCTTYGMHQYSWTESVAGISGDVDVSYCYKDFPSIIKAACLNGYSSASYTVTATIKNVTNATADSIVATCKALGMSTTKTQK